MDKIWLVFRNEIRQVIGRRSFFLALILTPLITFIVITIISSSQSGNQSDPITQVFSPAEEPEIEGYVDESGLIQNLPDNARGRLAAYPNEADAAAALGSGEIDAYYIISADFLQTGEVVYVRPDFNPMSGFEQSAILEETLNLNLLKGDVKLLQRYQNPLGDMERDVQSVEAQAERTGMTAFFLPYAVTMIFYIVIFSSASLMLNSITDEKQNRVIEILMTSVTPVQLLTGKIFALGIAGLLQTLVWAGAGFGLMRLRGDAINLPESVQLPVSILVWGVVFFLLGYAVYASLMAGVGALVPNLREASQATMVVIIPLVIPLMMISVLIEDPNGPLATGLSLFPLTAPVTMMTRLAASNTVPVWQPLLAIVLLLITAYFTVRAVAGMFRAQNLLSGQAFSLKLFFNALIGKA